MTALGQETGTIRHRRTTAALASVSEDELTGRVQHAGEVWEDLLEQLTRSGLLPPVELARQVVAFLGVELPAAEEAHTELLRRWVLAEVTESPHPVEMRRGLDVR